MSKEIQPPSYEEAMHAATAPPQVDFKYPNPNIGVTQPSTPYVPPPMAQAQNVPIHSNPTAPPHVSHGGYQQVPSYGAFETTPVNVVIQQTPHVVPQEIIVIGGCPACRIGILEDSYPCIGLLCAIVFFPVGILFCLAMKNKRCSNCNTEF